MRNIYPFIHKDNITHANRTGGTIAKAEGKYFGKK